MRIERQKSKAATLRDAEIGNGVLPNSIAKEITNLSIQACLRQAMKNVVRNAYMKKTEIRRNKNSQNSYHGAVLDCITIIINVVCLDIQY